MGPTPHFFHGELERRGRADPENGGGVLAVVLKRLRAAQAKHGKMSCCGPPPKCNGKHGQGKAIFN
jgi:hypothetical protein